MRHTLNVTIDTPDVADMPQEKLLSIVENAIAQAFAHKFHTITVVSIPDHTQEDEVAKTHRGFGIQTFQDRYGKVCSIQDSSLATEAAIWLGVEEATPQILNHGWKPVPFPEGTLFSTRMHLTERHVRKLLPLLKRFLTHGCIR